MSFSSKVSTTARRSDPLYYGQRERTFSARGPQVLALENGRGMRLENDEYLLQEGEWPEFDSEVSLASLRD